MNGPEKSQVTWQTEERVLTLDGEPVLHYSMTWPQITGAGRGGWRINRYYARLAQSWGQRWQREVYWAACLSLAQCRASSHPFTPWEGGLKGEVTLWQDSLLSLRMEGWEMRDEHKTSRVRWGDVWKVAEGAPCPLRELMPKRGWRHRLLESILHQGRQRKEAGLYVPDQDWERKAKRFFPEGEFCLTPDGLEFAYPQCTIKKKKKGNFVFQISNNIPAGINNGFEKFI